VGVGLERVAFSKLYNTFSNEQMSIEKARRLVCFFPFLSTCIALSKSPEGVSFILILNLHGCFEVQYTQKARDPYFEMELEQSSLHLLSRANKRNARLTIFAKS